jgi:hypothetical protein
MMLRLAAAATRLTPLLLPLAGLMLCCSICSRMTVLVSQYARHSLLSCCRSIWLPMTCDGAHTHACTQGKGRSNAVAGAETPCHGGRLPSLACCSTSTQPAAQPPPTHTHTWMMRSNTLVRSAWNARQCRQARNMTSAARGFPL